MKKRKPIPAALHHELTEYSSLLRALRTSQTLDVTAHLTQPYQQNNDEFDELGPSGSTPAPSASNEFETSAQKQLKFPHVPHWRNRDQWTRWPIPAKEVPKPDWNLQDEIEAIVKQVLAHTQSASDSSSEDDEFTVLKQEQTSENELDSNSEDEDAYTQRLAESITPVIQNHLESLFALISAHTIARSDSMQNRIEPFDWHDLVNILGSPAAAHLVDETILQNVVARMEEMFDTTPASASNPVLPPSPARANQRHNLTQTSRSRLNNLFSKHTASLFEQPTPPSGHKYITTYQISARRKKRRRPADQNQDEEVEQSEEENGKGRTSLSSVDNVDIAHVGLEDGHDLDQERDPAG